MMDFFLVTLHYIRSYSANTFSLNIAKQLLICKVFRHVSRFEILTTKKKYYD